MTREDPQTRQELKLSHGDPITRAARQAWICVIGLPQASVHVSKRRAREKEQNLRLTEIGLRKRNLQIYFSIRKRSREEKKPRFKIANIIYSQLYFQIFVYAFN